MIIRGKVIEGRALGRKLGFPTANIAIEESLQIENGVYISEVLINGVKYKAVSNIGTKPTVGHNVKGLETHILDFNEDIYGQEIMVDIKCKLRDERRFDSVETLCQQVKQDIEIVKNLKE